MKFRTLDRRILVLLICQTVRWGGWFKRKSIFRHDLPKPFSFFFLFSAYVLMHKVVLLSSGYFLTDRNSAKNIEEGPAKHFPLKNSWVVKGDEKVLLVTEQHLGCKETILERADFEGSVSKSWHGLLKIGVTTADKKQERKKVINICPSFSTVTNKNSWRVKSAFSNVVSLLGWFLLTWRKSMPVEEKDKAKPVAGVLLFYHKPHLPGFLVAKSTIF